MSIGESVSGNLTRLENFVNDLPERKVRLEKRLEQLKSDLEIAKEQVEKPFEQAEQLSALLSEQAELNAELNLDKREEVIVDDDGEGEEENYRAMRGGKLQGDTDIARRKTEKGGKHYRRGR